MNDRTIFVFSEKNKNTLSYCIKYGYSYLVTSEIKNLLNLLEKFIYSHDKIIIIQDHVKWISEQEVDIRLDGKAFAVCKWDLGVICLDLRHKDTKSFIHLFRTHKEFWKTWSCIKSTEYKEVERAKKIFRNPLTKYNFKNYNSLDDWNLFNFDGSNTKVETYKKTTFVYTHSIPIQHINIAIATIILPRIELPWLNEWINYHKKIGVTKFLIYNNGFVSEDTQYKSKLDSFEKQYKWSKKPNCYYITDKHNEEVTKELYNLATAHPEVEIVEWVKGVNHGYSYPESQMQMVYDSCKDKKYKWLYIDPDEFLQLHKNTSIQEYLVNSNNLETLSLRIPSKLFSERKLGKPVSSITTWSMNEEMRKCLVSGEVSRDSTIHELNVGTSHKYATREDIEIYHYCGSPLDHKDESRIQKYKEQGYPSFDKKIYQKKINKIVTFIFSWTGQFENAKKLEKEISKFSKVIVVNSDEDNTKENWVNISNNDYFTNQIKKALDLFDGDILAHIQADCTYDGWESLYSHADKELSKGTTGIYAPNIDYTPFKSEVVDIKHYEGNMKYVSCTDETMWFIHKDVIRLSSEYHYLFDNNKLGYGWDLLMASVSWINELLVVRDYNHTITHPQSKGYSDTEARDQMRDTLKKAPYPIASCIKDIKGDHLNIYNKYIKKDIKEKVYTTKLAVVLVATERELINGDVRRCLDCYIQESTSLHKIDFFIFFNKGEEHKFEDLKRYEMYSCVNKVLIKSHKLSNLDDIYIRTPEEVKAKKVIPTLGASAGANNLFFNSMIPLMDEKYNNYLMIETDSRPLKQNWIDRIIEYSESNKFLIGGSQYKGNSELPNEHEPWTGHLNGIAIYRKSKKLKYLLVKSKEFIKFQVKHKSEYFLSFDCAIHLYISTRKGLRFFRNLKTPWNWIKDTSIITNMSLPQDKLIEINEVQRRFPDTIILHQKFK